jgi:hypothetical protein
MSMNQQPGAWKIDGRRCEPVDARIPTTDFSEMEQQKAAKARNWAICDAVCSVALVLVLAFLIAGAS